MAIEIAPSLHRKVNEYYVELQDSPATQTPSLIKSRLAPPKRPPKPNLSIMIFRYFCLITGIFTLVICGFSPNIPASHMIIRVFFLAVGFIGIGLAFLWSREYRDERQWWSEQSFYWDAYMGLWNKLYYCAEHDIVFSDDLCLRSQELQVYWYSSPD